MIKIEKNDDDIVEAFTYAKMNDQLYFYSKSKDVPVGKGVNEVVEDALSYQALNQIKEWRRILSNFHICPFEYDGYTYNSIEHAFQAKKIGIVDKEKMYLFTLDSGDEIGLGNGEIARKNRKICKLNKEELKQWNMIKDDIMYEISLAKYKTCKDAYDVLKATNEAQLWHIVPRGKSMRFHHLERIRTIVCPT